MRITTADLRRAIDLLLRRFETDDASEWEIDGDFYWDVVSEGRYDSYDPPAQLGVGQLSYDIERVLAIAHGTSEPVPPGLVWVAAILRVAGERGTVSMRGKLRS